MQSDSKKLFKHLITLAKICQIKNGWMLRSYAKHSVVVPTVKNLSAFVRKADFCGFIHFCKNLSNLAKPSVRTLSAAAKLSLTQPE